MNSARTFSLIASLLFPWFFNAAAGAAPSGTGGSAGIKALFKNPPREYSTGPLWVWNDLLTEQ